MQTSFETLSVVEILADLDRLGCTYWLDEKQQFRVKPKSRIPDELQEMILLHRAALAKMIEPLIAEMEEEVPHPAEMEAVKVAGKTGPCPICADRRSPAPKAPVVAACPCCGSADLRHPHYGPMFCCNCWASDAWLIYLLPILEGRDEVCECEAKGVLQS